MAWPKMHLPWRQPVLEAGPLLLTSRRLFILPTRLGLLFCLLLLVLLLASLNYGIAPGYLFTFLVAGIGMSGLLHTQRNLLGLNLRPLAVAPVYAGERARFRLLLDNPARRWRGALVLRSDADHSQEVDLAPQSTGEIVLEIRQHQRGWQRPGRLLLASSWPLGLFRCWTVFALDWGVLVYPAPADSSLPLPEFSGQRGSSARPAAGDEEFALLRPYQAGDSARRIAWKSISRGRVTLTKHFIGTAGGALWLDWQDCPERGGEERLSRLARWALDAEAAGQAWGLRLPGRQLAPNRGRYHLHRALEALARHDGS